MNPGEALELAATFSAQGPASWLKGQSSTWCPAEACCSSASCGSGCRSVSSASGVLLLLLCQCVRSIRGISSASCARMGKGGKNKNKKSGTKGCEQPVTRDEDVATVLMEEETVAFFQGLLKVGPDNELCQPLLTAQQAVKERMRAMQHKVGVIRKDVQLGLRQTMKEFAQDPHVSTLTQANLLIQSSCDTGEESYQAFSQCQNTMVEAMLLTIQQVAQQNVKVMQVSTSRSKQLTKLLNEAKAQIQSLKEEVGELRASLIEHMQYQHSAVPAVPEEPEEAAPEVQAGHPPRGRPTEIFIKTRMRTASTTASEPTRHRSFSRTSSAGSSVPDLIDGAQQEARRRRPSMEPPVVYLQPTVVTAVPVYFASAAVEQIVPPYISNLACPLSPAQLYGTPVSTGGYQLGSGPVNC